jgi:protein involved in polysaccharide export with SLBB domain
MTSAPAPAQVPIPLQEQIRIFNSLPPSQQQALIRELQSQLPPAQRDAILGMLQQGRGSAQQSAPTGDTELPAALEATEPFDFESLIPKFAARDTLVIEFRPRENPTVPLTSDEEQALPEVLTRFENGNPYRLDDAGRLYLAGVPAIELAGLDVDQATTRVRAEPQLRAVDVTLTRLPLEPVGTEALEPFGYDLFDDVPSTFAPATDIPVPVDYVIGPGDTVNVQLFGNQNEQHFLTVTREGVINFPEIGPLIVSGLTFTDLRNTINERVTEQMIGVRASTTLGELRSIRIFVLGDVERPGSYTVSGLATMTNALFASGGVSGIGSLRNISLLRNGDTVTTLDLYELLLRGDTSGDARLQPGDAIFVPPIGPTVAVDGEIRRPAIYEIKNEQSVTDMIALAGGLNSGAYRSAVKLERIVPGRGIAVTDVDISLPAGGDQPVRDGDVLRVQPNLDQLENSVRLAGNAQRAGLYQWRPGMTLSDLLPGPELVKPLSDLNYVLIRRENAPNVDVDVLSADLDGVWQRRAGAVDIALEPRDTVYVFHLDIGRRQFVDPILEELEAQAAPNEAVPIVRVGGQVRAEGEYPLEPGMRVSDLLRAGGGLSAAAYAIDAELTRYMVVDGEYRETELVTVELASVLGGNAETDFVLLPYDYLNIKEVSRWRGQQTVTLRGELVFPGNYPIRQGETLSSVLDRAGGVTQFAFPQGSVFTRVEIRDRERQQLLTLARRVEADLASISLSDPSAGDAVSIGQSLLNQLRNAEVTGRVTIRLDDIIAGRRGTDIVLQDGDDLFVPEIRQEVAVLGEVQYATSHLFNATLTREDYIDRSGGLTRRADRARIYVVRANGEVISEGGGRWFRRAGDTDIRPGDTIVAPIEVDRVRPLALWGSVTQIIYNLAIAAAAVNSFN